MEKDNEIKGSGNSYDFGARLYDAWIGKFLSIDSLIMFLSLKVVIPNTRSSSSNTTGKVHTGSKCYKLNKTTPK